MRVADYRPGTRLPSTARGAATPATPAAASPARRPFFAPPPAPQDQERVPHHPQCPVVLPAAPAPAFEVIQAQRVFQLLIAVFDPPPPLGRPHQPPQRRAR